MNFFARFRESNKRSETPCSKNVHFIISAPRSGTTWLQYSLNAHPDIFCTENRLFGDFAEIWPDNDGTRNLRITLDKYIARYCAQVPVNAIGTSAEKYQDIVMRNVMREIINTGKQMSGKTYLIDKITPYLETSSKVVNSVLNYFPESKLIYLSRDGRDVLTSGAFDWLKKDSHATDRYRYFVLREKGFRLTRFFDDDLIAKWVKYWTQPYQAFVSCKKEYFQVSYEQLLSNYKDTLSSLLDYVEIPYTHGQIQKIEKLSSFMNMSGGRKQGENGIVEKQRKGISGDWKNYFVKEDGLLFEKLAGEQLRQLGYTDGPWWVDSLPEELDMTPY